MVQEAGCTFSAAALVHPLQLACDGVRRGPADPSLVLPVKLVLEILRFGRAPVGLLGLAQQLVILLESFGNACTHAARFPPHVESNSTVRYPTGFAQSL